jgi:hypothetical protein
MLHGLAAVEPLPLDELEVPVQVRPDKGKHQAAVGAVVVQHAGARALMGAFAEEGLSRTPELPPTWF